jgi:aspartate racemase
MEQEFYRGRLERRHHLEVVLPDEADREVVHRVIYEELCCGRVLESSRREFGRIVQSLSCRQAGGVILGCTEIGLLLRPEDVKCPLFDTTMIHARHAARYALGEESAALSDDHSG